MKFVFAGILALAWFGMPCIAQQADAAAIPDAPLPQSGRGHHGRNAGRRRSECPVGAGKSGGTAVGQQQFEFAGRAAGRESGERGRDAEAEG